MAQILVVEPDVRLAGVYARALQTLGHTSAVAATAQAAVLAADSASPDLVLLELQLTAHSGIEFLYEFRSYPEWREVPVIVMSLVPPAEFESSQQLLFEQLGVVAYCYKPRTSLQQLLRKVREVLAMPEPELAENGFET